MRSSKSELEIQAEADWPEADSGGGLGGGLGGGGGDGCARQILSSVVAASLVPSLDEVMEVQLFVLPLRRCPESTWRRVCRHPDVAAPNNGGEFGTVAR